MMGQPGMRGACLAKVATLDASRLKFLLRLHSLQNHAMQCHRQAYALFDGRGGKLQSTPRNPVVW